jgi:hypothetical protein
VTRTLAASVPSILVLGRKRNARLSAFPRTVRATTIFSGVDSFTVPAKNLSAA